MSEKIQTDSLERIEASSVDNVLMTVDATVNWRVKDVETASRFSAETMRSDGAESRNDAGAGTPKLRKDVLMQVCLFPSSSFLSLLALNN